MTWRRGQRLARWALVASLALVQAAAQPRGGNRTWARETVEQMARRFGLTESQKQQALVVYMKVEEDSRPIEKKIADQRMALRDAVKDSSPEWQIDQMSGAVGALVAQLTAIETKGEAKFYALLNAEQRQKWDQPFRGPGRGPGGRPGIPPTH
jgi:Spy/CpxP family protein refolding chaperone